MQNAADTGSLTLERFEPLLAHTQAPDAMRTLIAAYLDAWEKTAPPARTDLNFRTLAPYMPNLTIMERRDGRYLYRLVGTEVVERMTRDLTGENVFDYFAPGIHSGVRQGFEAVIDDCCISLFIYENTYSNGVMMKVESLLLPIASGVDGEAHHMLAWHIRHNDRSFTEQEELVFQSSIVGQVFFVPLKGNCRPMPALRALAPVEIC